MNANYNREWTQIMLTRIDANDKSDAGLRGFTTRINADSEMRIDANNINANGRELNDNKSKNNIKNFIVGVLVGVLIVSGLLFLKVPAGQKVSNQNFNQALIQQIIEQVLPKEGFKTNLVWKDTVKKND